MYIYIYIYVYNVICYLYMYFCILICIFALDSKSDVDVDYGDYSFSRYISIAAELDVLNRPDDNNFRLLMCQTMVKFPQLVESKSRDVLPLFFTFLR